MASFTEFIEEKTGGKGADDYARMPVPEEKRRSWIGSGVVFVGCAISLSAFLLGGTLAMGLSLTNTIIAVMAGSGILSLMTCVCAKVALHTHLSTSMICKFTFGVRGAALVGLIYAIVAWGWFGVQVGLFGDTISSMYTLMTGGTFSAAAIKVIMVLGGVLMTSSAIFGYKSIEKLSILAIPLISILMLASLYLVLRGETYADLDMPALINTPMSIGVGISSVIGAFAAGAVGSPDILRYAKNFKDTVKATVLGMMIGFGITIIIAAVCAKATGEANIVNIMIGLGWGVLAMIVLILAQWTSNDNNIYSASLGFSVVFDNMPKYQLAILTGVVGTVFAVCGISNALIPFFSMLGIFTPPIGGCYVADYYMNNRYYDFENLVNVPKIRKETVIAYFCAVGFGFLVTPQPAGLGLFSITTVAALDTFIAAAVFQLIFVKLLNKNYGRSCEAN